VQSTVTIGTRTLREADVEEFRKQYNERLAARKHAAE
jgi:hypothetical protein